jgi:hypothetical protein
MMMRMLAAGGAPILADRERAPDVDNPRGYYELAAVKSTRHDAMWTRDAPGRVVKVISALLPSLPNSIRWKVVFMRRDLDQVVRSQRLMLARREGVVHSDAHARQVLVAHLVEIEAWLERADHMNVVGVSYERVLADPRGQAERIDRFLGLALDVDAMARTVEPGLQRQRSLGRT